MLRGMRLALGIDQAGKDTRGDGRKSVSNGIDSAPGSGGTVTGAETGNWMNAYGNWMSAWLQRIQALCAVLYKRKNVNCGAENRCASGVALQAQMTLDASA